MTADKTPSQLKQMLYRLEMDEIYWQGLQQYSTNPAVQSMATTNLADIRQRKDELLQALKRPQKVAAKVVPGFMHGQRALDASFGRYRNPSETSNVHLQPHEGNNLPPTSTNRD
jgi:hypothetical protein